MGPRSRSAAYGSATGPSSRSMRTTRTTAASSRSPTTTARTTRNRIGRPTARSSCSRTMRVDRMTSSTINPDGSNQQNLIHPGVSNPPNDPFNPPTPNGAIDNQAAWSPDGPRSYSAPTGPPTVVRQRWTSTSGSSTRTARTRRGYNRSSVRHRPRHAADPVCISPAGGRLTGAGVARSGLQPVSEHHRSPAQRPARVSLSMPPSIGSTNLTVGTPDLNGQSAAASGLAEVKVINALLPTRMTSTRST